MSATDRIDVLYAARLEGPGRTRWTSAQLMVVALRSGSQCTLSATLEEDRHRRGELWSLALKSPSEQEAVAKARAIAANPNHVVDDGGFDSHTAGESEIRQLFGGLTLKSEIDTTQGPRDLAAHKVTIGAGRQLATLVEKEEPLNPEAMMNLERFLSAAPFNFGYWAPFKRITKHLEKRADATTPMAVALARLDGKLRAVNGHADEKLRQFFAPHWHEVAGDDTLAYMMRRGRRLLRRLGKTDKAAYLDLATAFLRATDTQGSAEDIGQRWILAYIIYGRGMSTPRSGHGPVQLPPTPQRYARRWDQHPMAWNGRLGDVRWLWSHAASNPDIQSWAFNVLRAGRHDIPRLTKAALRLALLSPSVRVRTQACTQIAATPETFLDLDQVHARAFLEFSSPKQFAAVYPLLESSADQKRVADAVLSYADDHGLLAIRRGGRPEVGDSRVKGLLAFTLKFLRHRLSDIDTFQLALFIGQTTKFSGARQWRDTFNGLPLKTLIELRLQLPDLPRSAAGLIDAACKDAAARGASDENLAAALTLSPASNLRGLGWQMLEGASPQALATVWDQLTTHSAPGTARARLLEALRNTGRLDTLLSLPEASQLLAAAVLAIAGTEPKLAERLMRRLAEFVDTARTLQTLQDLLERHPEVAWPRSPALLYRLTLVDAAITHYVWSAAAANRLVSVANVHVATKTLAAALIQTLEPAGLLTISGGQPALLDTALRKAPQRMREDRAFAIAVSTCPSPAVHQRALTYLEARDQIAWILVPLAENGLPAAAAAAERYLRRLKDPDILTKALISICDSASRHTRSLGLQLLLDREGHYERTAILSALAEHTAPEIAAFVAEHALAGNLIRRDTLQAFDRRILRTRRSGRRAKNLVKTRLGHPHPPSATAITATHTTDQQRLAALLDIARSSSQRDREWALQQLAQLAMDGHAIAELKVSATS